MLKHSLDSDHDSWNLLLNRQSNKPIQSVLGPRTRPQEVSTTMYEDQNGKLGRRSMSFWQRDVQIEAIDV